MSKAGKLIKLLEMADGIYTIGDKVIVRNVNQNPTVLRSDVSLPDEVTGTVMFHCPDDRIAIQVGDVQIIADPDDVELIKPDTKVSSEE